MVEGRYHAGASRWINLRASTEGRKLSIEVSSDARELVYYPSAPETMTLLSSYLPLRPELDGFLFATVGEEQDGMPLSVISALTGLGLNPWDEAARLSSLERRDAVEQLIPTIARLPGDRWTPPQIRQIALDLIELLPSTKPGRAAGDAGPPAGAKTAPSLTFWLVCLLLVAAAIISMVANGDLPFGGHGQSAPVSPPEAPLHSD